MAIINTLKKAMIRGIKVDLINLEKSKDDLINGLDRIREDTSKITMKGLTPTDRLMLNNINATLLHLRDSISDMENAKLIPTNNMLGFTPNVSMISKDITRLATSVTNFGEQFNSYISISRNVIENRLHPEYKVEKKLLEILTTRPNLNTIVSKVGLNCLVPDYGNKFIEVTLESAVIKSIAALSKDPLYLESCNSSKPRETLISKVLDITPDSVKREHLQILKMFEVTSWDSRFTDRKVIDLLQKEEYNTLLHKLNESCKQYLNWCNESKTRHKSEIHRDTLSPRDLVSRQIHVWTIELIEELCDRSGLDLPLIGVIDGHCIFQVHSDFPLKDLKKMVNNRLEDMETSNPNFTVNMYESNEIFKVLSKVKG